ncbi:MAG: hypothetical protein MUD08_03780 [Cytophagales bacterium]|nr:hypothetical protein [Cytophagales bacterium]
MAQFTLDYTRNHRPPADWRRQRRFLALAMLLGGLLAAVAGMLHYRGEHQRVQSAYWTQLVRHDSLLNAKRHADDQLLQMRTRLQQLEQQCGQTLPLD